MNGAETGAARAFATAVPLTRPELIAAPVHWPRPSRLAAPLEPSGKRMAAGLRALGLQTVGELLEHLPTDSRQAGCVAQLRAGEQATVSVEVRTIAARSVRRRRMRPLVEAIVFDATGSMRATFFNQPWLVDRYPPGTRLLLHGKADGRGGFRVSHHAPAPQDAAAPDLSSRNDGTVAHYPAADGITSTQILTLVQSARAALGDVPEFLSAASRVSDGLPDRAAALAAMHLPRSGSDLEDGRRRLAYEELLLTQLLFLRRRSRRLAGGGAPALARDPELTARWLEGSLPFAPTGDQRRAMAEIDRDIARERPMQRLLMGEVGSGKTVVALYAMLRAVEHGAQAALMAPTETLAEQHFATIQRLLGGESVSAALLTGSTPARRRGDALTKLASGELSLLVGTHALIEPDVAFRSLAVAVIDEQHRFGVRQREALVAGGEGARRAHPAHDRHADPADAVTDPIRRPGDERSARAAQRQAPDPHAAGVRRGRPRRDLRGCAARARCGQAGLRRVPADRAGAGGGGRLRTGGGRCARARGASGRHGRARATSRRGARRLRACASARRRCERGRSSWRWSASSQAAPRCSWPPP